MQGCIFAGGSSRRFGDPSRWLINKRGGRWYVRPPIGTFWGSGGQFDTGDQAVADYRRQTEHVKG
ncbi:hypothetical protein SEA_EFRA2_67 [Mycobacterium phage Efra2]|nr:hypothetical protein SEA_EFRA2_67 [Mycobacterium phage Efra2]